MLIDWFTVAAQAVNFLVLVWLLKRFLYKPVLAAIDEREKRIAAQLLDAEKKKAEALKEQTDFSAQRTRNSISSGSGLCLKRQKRRKPSAINLWKHLARMPMNYAPSWKKVFTKELENLNKKIGTLAQQEVFSIARKTLSDLAGVSLEQRMTDILSNVSRA